MESCRTEDSFNHPQITQMTQISLCLYLCILRNLRTVLPGVAVPDLGFRAFLATLYAGAAWNRFRISGSSLRDVPAFVFRNLRQRSAAENRNRGNLRYFLFRRVVIAMLDQQPLSIASSHQHPRAF